MTIVGVESENGWRPARIGVNQLDRSPVPGTDIVIPLMGGYPSILLKAFLADVHERVESLYNSRGGTDEGGWTPINSVNTSNHLNGTAVDMNWSDHPMGPPAEQAGWSPQEIAEMRKLLAFYNFEGLQLIWWAADWDSPKDSMHFQMGYGTYENQDKLKRFVEKFIRPDGFSTYSRGAVSIPRKPVVPGDSGTTWADVSQYQSIPINIDYPYRVVSFRTNSGDQKDSLADANAKVCLELLNAGKLDLVIPYYFFRPGQANCDLHREILESAGLFNHPRTVSMVDVEGDNGSVSGDNSWEINDEVNRIRLWYNNSARVIGYLNPNADPGLWPTRLINLVIPQYNQRPGDISGVRDESARNAAIAHQFTDRADFVPPWVGRGIDLNWSPYSVDELLQLFGIIEVQNPSDGGFFMALSEKQQQEIYDKIMAYPGVPEIGGKWPSRAIFADGTEGVDDTVGMILNSDGNIWDIFVILGALSGISEHVARVKRLANGEGPNGKNERFVKIAQELLRFIETES